jgi:hypothetical protein
MNYYLFFILGNRIRNEFYYFIAIWYWKIGWLLFVSNRIVSLIYLYFYCVLLLVK